jgi:hypothetical protein
MMQRHILVKGCGKRGDIESARDDDGQANVKSESSSDDAEESPAVNGQ